MTTQARVAEVERLTPATIQRPLPPDFTAVERMSDATGVLHRARCAVPDRGGGYRTDDNARALMLVCRMPGLAAAARERWTTTYAAFLQHAWDPAAGRFRETLGYDRRWPDEPGSEDANGRAFWALGVVARDAGSPEHRDWAAALFDEAAAMALALEEPRAQAFAMLGAAAMLEARPGHAAAAEVLERFPPQHMALLEAARRPEWRWFEIVLAYDNARLPEALIRAGTVLGRSDLLACGVETLAWILEKQTGREGRFRAVGTDSFGREYSDPLPFDQKPLEAQATIDACEAAYAATGDVHWVKEAERAYRWFLGANDLDLPLATPNDGGCYDALKPTGLDRNQGAESILALQLANCAMARLAGRAQPPARLAVNR